MRLKLPASMRQVSYRRQVPVPSHHPRPSVPSERQSRLRALGTALLTLSFLAISWNAVRLDGFEPGQILLALAVAALGLNALRDRQAIHVPSGMLAGATLIAAAGLMSSVLPAPAQYVSSRFNPSALGAGLGSAAVGPGNLTQLAKFEVALIGVILAVLLLRPSISEVRRLASAWAVSALVSAAVAASDASGHTNISASLLGLVDFSGRQAGLTVQPNHLAVSMALVVPILLFWVVDGGARIKCVGAIALALVAYGSVLAGSRGGAAGMLIAVSLFVLLTPKLRLPALLFGLPLLTLLTCIAFLVFPSILLTIVTDVRLAGGLGPASDAGHALALHQGFLDIQQSPIFGIGYDHLDDATEVHLQLWAAGGILGLLGYLVYWFSVLRASRVAIVVDAPLASALLASVLTFMVLNFLENQVADTYLYVPAALLVSLTALSRRQLTREPLRMIGSQAPHLLLHRVASGAREDIGVPRRSARSRAPGVNPRPGTSSFDRSFRR